MISKDIQQLLQECLDGFDGGLTPEECLSAYPRVRAELEPLFRQALSLRVAYAASPQPEFRFRAREKLLFAAGRDVTLALTSQPDPAFVSTTRQRLLNTAGAGAQEALRDVPPPRLPFWVNTRRHLLETAATTPLKPAPRMPVGLRTALSAAVIVLAVSIAGAGFFLQDSPANQLQRSASADLEFLSEQVSTAEQLQRSGETFSTSLLDDLATLTSKLAEDYASDNPDPAVKELLPDLIVRQQLLAEASPLDETVALAQQRLDEADKKVAAANAEESPEATITTGAAATAASPEPTVEPTSEATSTPDIPDVALVSPADLEPGQIVTQYDASATDLGLRWWLVTTNAMTFSMPETWEITNVTVDENGLAVLEVPYVFIQTDVAGLTLLVSTETGQVSTAFNGQEVILRTADGSVIELADLVEVAGPDANTASLYNMLNSITLVNAAPEPTATPEATETVTPTLTATLTATPAATATPDDTDSETNP
jgi:hypothetical protein